MVGVNKNIKASSLIECVVASVIILVCFVLTMDILTRITLSEKDPSLDINIELSIRRCYREYSNHVELGNFKKQYEWGEMEISLSHYIERIRKLTIKAIPTKGIRTVKYDYLIRYDEEL